MDQTKHGASVAFRKRVNKAHDMRGVVEAGMRLRAERRGVVVGAHFTQARRRGARGAHGAVRGAHSLEAALVAALRGGQGLVLAEAHAPFDLAGARGAQVVR